MSYQASPPGYYPPQPSETNWWAILSLIFGVIGGVLISVICGVIGLDKAKQGNGGRGLAIAGLTLSGLWVLLIALGVLFYLSYLVTDEGTVDATDLNEGDCLSEIPEGTRVLTVNTIACEEPHAGEVFALLTVPEEDFPGQDAIDEYADKCGPELESYSPAVMSDGSAQLFVLYPTAESWAQGDRVVTCIATLDPPRTGSIKG